MTNEIADNGAMPDFIQNAEVADDGFDENIEEEKKTFPTYSVAQPVSNGVAEGWATPGDIAINSLEETLEAPRKVLFFAKDVNFRCPQDDRRGTVCFSVTREVGFPWLSDDMDQEAMDEFGVTQEDIEQDRRGFTHDCNKCNFHPNNWVDKKPPRCKREHVYYFLDVTEGFDEEPKRLRIKDSNKPASEAIEAFDSQFINNLKRKNAPLYGGVFSLDTKSVEYGNGNKGFQFEIDFESYVKNEKLFNYALECRQQFKDRRKDMIDQAKQEAIQEVTEEEDTKHEKASDDWDSDEGSEPAWPEE